MVAHRERQSAGAATVRAELNATIKGLERQRAAVAHLIKLAIAHGANATVEDRLNDALIELGREG